MDTASSQGLLAPPSSCPISVIFRCTCEITFSASLLVQAALGPKIETGTFNPAVWEYRQPYQLAQCKLHACLRTSGLYKKHDLVMVTTLTISSMYPYYFTTFMATRILTIKSTSDVVHFKLHFSLQADFAFTTPFLDP